MQFGLSLGVCLLVEIACCFLDVAPGLVEVTFNLFGCSAVGEGFVAYGLTYGLFDLPCNLIDFACNCVCVHLNYLQDYVG